jgi:hypothetical protein
MEKDKYISLSKAAQLCPYNQGYLSLRARQGKLKAIKLGRNWMTKEEWLNEYVKKTKKPHSNLKKEKPKPIQKQKQRFNNLNFNLIIFLAFSVLIFALLTISEQGFLGLFNDANYSLKLTSKGLLTLGNCFLNSSQTRLFAFSGLWQDSFGIFNDYFSWLSSEIPLKAEAFSLFFAK